MGVSGSEGVKEGKHRAGLAQLLVVEPPSGVLDSGRQENSGAAPCRDAHL